ncbi:unnamed protein product [Ilex paraguariensis]|uniref:Uncharacterized protein n=1 Tax=Ilex paraguariensis TaxID=185542 RepID=A0ABC8R0A0_9AQUA
MQKNKDSADDVLPVAVTETRHCVYFKRNKRRSQVVDDDLDYSMYACVAEFVTLEAGKRMMGRSPCCDEDNLKKGPWTPEEDQKLMDYIHRHGHGSWRALPKLAGLNRCGKSCRLRWTNYLRPDIKRGKFTEEEERLIINLHERSNDREKKFSIEHFIDLSGRWSAIATRLPGRTDNEIKNFWNTHIRKKLLQMGIDPVTHRPRTDLDVLANLPHLLASANWGNPVNPWDNALTLQSDATQLAKIQLLHNILQVLSSGLPPTMEAPNFLGSARLPDHAFYNLNPDQFEGVLGNNPIALAPNPAHITPNFSSVVVPQHTNFDEYHPMANSKIFTGNNNDIDNNNYQEISGNNRFSTSYAIPSENSVPALVSASPERPSNSLREYEIMPTEINSSSSTSTTVEAWRDILDGEACESYWREIIDQASSSPWPVSP